MAGIAELLEDLGPRTGPSLVGARRAGRWTRQVRRRRHGRRRDGHRGRRSSRALAARTSSLPRRAWRARPSSRRSPPSSCAAWSSRCWAGTKPSGPLATCRRRNAICASDARAAGRPAARAGPVRSFGTAGHEGGRARGSAGGYPPPSPGRTTRRHPWLTRPRPRASRRSDAVEDEPIAEARDDAARPAHPPRRGTWPSRSGRRAGSGRSGSWAQPG